jgi:hypothetical protein
VVLKKPCPNDVPYSAAVCEKFCISQSSAVPLKCQDELGLYNLCTSMATEFACEAGGNSVPTTCDKELATYASCFK